MPFITYCTLLYSHTGHCYLKRILRDKMMLEETLPKRYKCSCLLNFQLLWLDKFYDFGNIFHGGFFLKEIWFWAVFLRTCQRLGFRSCKGLLILLFGRPRQQGGKVPDSRLETYWPYLTASPNPQIPRLLTGSRWRRQWWGSTRQCRCQKLLRMWYPRLGRSWFSPCVKTTIHPCHSWQPLLGSSLCQLCAEFWTSWTLPALVFMRALLRGWILSIGWHGRLEDQTAVISSRRQGWICARASICFFVFAFSWSIVALWCCVSLRWTAEWFR